MIGRIESLLASVCILNEEIKADQTAQIRIKKFRMRLEKFERIRTVEIAQIGIGLLVNFPPILQRLFYKVLHCLSMLRTFGLNVSQRRRAIKQVMQQDDRNLISLVFWCEPFANTP